MTTIAQRVTTWRYVMNHANMPDGVAMDSVSKWLIVTRAAVFTMTATSGIIGGLLAIGTAGAAVNYWYLVLSVIGLVIAHAANNMINDYFDLEGGVDTDEYVRALYAPHPILSGWLTKAQLRNAILLMQAFDLAILIVLVLARGPGSPPSHSAASSSASSTSPRRSSSSTTAWASRASSSCGVR